ncbi:MAG: type II toxin-antitoxin system VapC family toxin [Actinomycetota bacterium]
MALLLDTQAAWWWLDDDARLDGHARSTIERAIVEREAFVSALSLLEAVGKAARGRVSFPPGFVDSLEVAGFRPLPFDAHDAIASQDLPRIHADPFDRGIAAQALRRDLTLMTSDARLAEYPIAVYRL